MSAQSGYNVVLYGSGLFGDSDPSVNQQQLQELQNSGFTTVILWTLHVHENGDFYYNDTLAVQNGTISSQLNPDLPQLITALKSGGTVNKVFFCIGSGGVSDYQAIKALLASPQGTQILQQNFQALVNAFPIDGFDFDLEEFPLSDYTDTIVQLTLMLNQSYGKAITYCPYTDEDFWLNCLALVYTKNNNQQIVSWFNLQCYAGGSGNDPMEWASQIVDYASPLGISDPTGFIVPGYWARHKPTGPYDEPGECPASICHTFSTLDLKGGFIWNSGDIFKSEASGLCSGSMAPSAYASAIINGLNREC